MRKEERKIYTRCIAIMAVYIIAGVWLYTMPSQAHTAQIAENVPYLDETVSGEEFTAEPSETPKKGQIRENTPMSAMPCDDPENFKRWMETYEQEQETCEQETEPEPEPTTVPTDECKVTTGTDETPVTFYSVNGETLNPELAQKLHDALEKYSIGYFWEIALAQCYQESHFNVYAVNPNNLIDSGILQYRATYWDWNRGDIFSVDAQFELYAEQMANRLNAGLSADECISRHKTSDFSTAVDWEYVGQVKQWLGTIREVEQ